MKRNKILRGHLVNTSRFTLVSKHESYIPILGDSMVDEDCLPSNFMRILTFKMGEIISCLILGFPSFPF